MLELKECCKVPFPEKLFEHYEIKENAIYANVNASKVLDMMKRFVAIHSEPLFFILEIPAKQEEYPAIDVFYIDGLDIGQALQCIDALGDFLVNDGLNTFGIGGHESCEEILFGKYNVMTLYTQNAENYCDFFRDFKIEQTDTLITAWDTFDQENPGESTILVSKKTGKTIYDIPAMYKEYGMYLHETRKEIMNEKS